MDSTEIEKKIEEIKADLNDTSLEMFDSLRQIVWANGLKTVLEIGSGWGVSGAAFLAAGAELTSVDKLSEIPEFWKRVNKFDTSKLKWTQSESNEFFSMVEDESFDLVFIDGSHNYEDVKADIENGWRVTKRFLVIDDILHKHNFDGGSYGIMKALLERFQFTNIPFIISGVSHGIAIIEKTI